MTSHTIAHLGDHSEIVGDQQYRQLTLAAQLVYQSQHLLLHRDVEGCRRLVGQQHLRTAHQCQRQHHPLRLTAAELMRIVRGTATRVRDPHTVESLTAAAHASRRDVDTHAHERRRRSVPQR